jgi:colanic acid biosynthesis glycosyl transferase WcaI
VKILILGLNYEPEPVGIGPYTTGTARALADAGHNVTVVTGKPYYPRWRIDVGYAGLGYRLSREHGVSVIRCPLYVPLRPSGVKRLIHHASFALFALPAVLVHTLRCRPNVVIAIAPSLIASPVARFAARVSGARFWLHIQDFEVEAAVATGLLRSDRKAIRWALAFERWALRSGRISTISPQMRAKLAEKGVPKENIVEFRNWASIDQVRPLSAPSPFRPEWGIDRLHVALYSGNIANKQGIEIVVQAARLLAHREDILFVICGNGVNRDELMARAAGLDNVRFFDLQPMERLSELLGLASVHLLPQIAGAVDLVLPSKLTNMLASGRPVVATAVRDSGLAHEVAGCGLVTMPGDPSAFAGAIAQLIDDDTGRRELGAAARRRAEEHWSKAHILARFVDELTAYASAERKKDRRPSA